MARNFTRGRGSVLTKIWLPTVAGDGIIDNVTITGTRASVASISARAINWTVLRMRGKLMVVAVPDAATDSDVVALGIIRAQADAIGTGGTALPSPLTDVNAAWLWHQYVPLDAAGLTAAASEVSVVQVVEIDSKAMRKIGPNEGVTLITELSTGDFSLVSMSGGLRVLSGE